MIPFAQKRTDLKLACFHCQEPADGQLLFDDKVFCCEGCKTVYQVLQDNGLDSYYSLAEGQTLGRRNSGADYSYLDDPQIVDMLLDYKDEQIAKITFALPAIHCSACIWLLENLGRLNDAIAIAKVNFIRREIAIQYQHERISLREVATLLDRIGYAPDVKLGTLDRDKKAPNINKADWYRLGVAGFCFGNIMLMSFPEYLGLEGAAFDSFRRFFGYFNILLSLPVLLYSSTGYFQSAWEGIKQRHANIDIPIAIGIIVLFGRSVYEILTQTGAGYLDSFAGLIFFLLIGKWFQRRSYSSLSFERDYKAYFPLAATLRHTNGSESSVPVNQLHAGDQIIVRHSELIPADGILMAGEARIDYSFVTGESQPVDKTIGNRLYAGGRQVGSAIEITLTRDVAQSYLTQLWNDSAFKETSKPAAETIADTVGRRFTWFVLIVAFATLLYWIPRDMPTAINAFTAVLIVACPCAIALSIPFTLGNSMRVLGRCGLYVKDVLAVENMARVKHIVMDKTGTLTLANKQSIVYNGTALDLEHQCLVKTLVKQSNHPVSRRIYLSLDGEDNLKITGYQEIVGSGVQANVNGHDVRIGSASFTGGDKTQKGTWISIDGQPYGYYHIENVFRNGLWMLLGRLTGKFNLSVISGDNDNERTVLESHFPANASLQFDQKPQDKLDYVKALQASGETVLMVGDGLNDAGALRSSEVGIVVTDDTNNFNPACDAILDGRMFDQLDQFLNFSRKSVRLIYGAFAISAMYNVVGLSFAVQGMLTPIVAAILMPLSSVSVVAFGIASGNILAWRMGMFKRAAILEEQVKPQSQDANLLEFELVK
jgi:Cu+-exporting ATPase